MFTANSMNCLAEALGIALPGNGTVLATSEDRKALYSAAAQRIVEMAMADGPKPRDIMTRAAFENAMILDMAMGGSTNTVLHILAIAHEAGVDFTLKDIDRLSRKTPNICKVAPSAGKDGRLYHIEDVHAAGGIMTILGELLRGKPGLLHGDAMTVTGKTLAENIQANDIRVRGETIRRDGLSTAQTERIECLHRKRWRRRRRDPDRSREQAVRSGRLHSERRRRLLGRRRAEYPVRQSGRGRRRGQDGRRRSRNAAASGPAVIFESQEAACEGILDGKVKAGDVVVIRYEGPEGDRACRRCSPRPAISRPLRSWPRRSP